ncbi:hypothetical protein [Aquimarina agarilytica]|uniref:hypothetical protein n=1 Tax=Aquimarina agarilytica TaxID=1087449 RepID=UPI00028A0B1B|nr:hypothetical protein [Aquimarina agarilytica]
MIFKPFTIYYFTPFYFSNGNLPKNKYFISIYQEGDSITFAYLPTSKDSVPDIYLSHGCVNVPEKQISCYIFKKDIKVTTNNFSFPLNTFIYAYQLNSFSKLKLEETYKNEDIDYEVVGILNDDEKNNLIDCLINSPNIKRKIKKALKR